MIVLRYSSRFHGVKVGSQIGLTGRRVSLRCASKVNAEKARLAVLELNGGAWPLGLRVESR